MVRSFDNSAAYKSLSGHGLKGVDFIAISPDEKLWLIEVKNYRPRRKGEKEYRADRRHPSDLAEQVATKFQDSIRLIRIVDAYLRRSWRRRLIIWWRENIRAKRASNYWFWSRSQQLCTSGSALEYVLWMETPENKSDYDVRVYDELRLRMDADASITVAENDYPQGLPITALPI